ncbi:MAG: molybdate ABC transporter substrate-binding protein [Candidatus Poribacteria bacterium]|nr:molybdate ABC transporter substrate-binding protein [Candidatus Poribacteria bacterium]
MTQLNKSAILVKIFYLTDGYVETEIMHRFFKSLILLCLLFMFILLLGCAQEQRQNELSVFAAISLKDALTEIGATFIVENQVKVYYNFAASTTLQRQLEKGASGDVFISASPRQVVALETNGLLEAESRRNLLTNRLVLVADETAEISVETPTNLVVSEISRIAIGHPDIVPAGAYAKEALTYFGLWETLRPKLIFGTDVRATLAYVTAGNVDIAVVYKTDTTLTEDINVLYQLPPEAYTPIIYPAVVMKESPQKQLARRFINYLQSMESGEIFEKHGFTVLASK